MRLSGHIPKEVADIWDFLSGSSEKHIIINLYDGRCHLARPDEALQISSWKSRKTINAVDRFCCCVCLSVWVFLLPPINHFTGHCLNCFVLSRHVKCTYFQLLSRRILRNHRSQIICRDQRGELCKPPLVRLRMLFISLLLWWARWRSCWLELIFASLFFSFLHFCWLIFIYTF